MIIKNEIVDFMENVPFFEGFSEKEKLEISKVESHVVQYISGDYVIREGQKDQSIFVILKGTGTITTEEAPKVEVNDLEAGAIFGEMSFLFHSPRSVNVKVKGDYLIALKLDSEMFEKLEPKLLSKVKDQLNKEIACRLNSMNGQICKLKNELNQIVFKHQQINNRILGLGGNVQNLGNELNAIKKAVQGKLN